MQGAPTPWGPNISPHLPPTPEPWAELVRFVWEALLSLSSGSRCVENRVRVRVRGADSLEPWFSPAEVGGGGCTPGQ